MESGWFDRTCLLDAFAEMGRMAWAEGATIEMAVYGGSALMMIYDWRSATKDVDGVFERDRAIVRRLAGEIAERRGSPADWRYYVAPATIGCVHIYAFNSTMRRFPRSREGCYV